MLRHLLKILFVICVSSVDATRLLAQDPQLSQFYAAPLYTNPALAGASGKIRFATSARSQYAAMPNNYKTAVASIDAFVPRFKSGLGLLAMYDVAGDGFLNTVSISGVYSYGIQINREWRLHLGLQGEIRQRNYDFNKFTFEDQLDPVRGKIYPVSNEVKGLETVSFMNFGAGALIYNEIFYAGVASHNLLQPNQSFYYRDADSGALLLPRRYTAHAGLNIYLTHVRNEQNRTSISPNILFMNQRSFYQINAGLYFKKQALTIGAWFRQTSRNADALIFLLGLRFPGFKVGYSYDLTVSNARTVTGGSHEVSLVVEISPRMRSGYRRNMKLVCPEM